MRWLSICGNVFFTGSTSAEMLKVEYLGRIEYDFQKYRVTGPWDYKDSVSAKQYEAKCHVCVPFNFAYVYLID
jgi:hypothetical protein